MHFAVFKRGCMVEKEFDAGTAPVTTTSPDAGMGSGLPYAIIVPGSEAAPRKIAKPTIEPSQQDGAPVGDSTPSLGFGEVPLEGCFVGIQVALSRPDIARQAHLSPNML